MPLLNWDETFSVGVKVFDDQHKKLFGLTNDLHKAIRKNNIQATIAGTLDGLVDYTLKHFALEEILMMTHNYPGLAEHKIEHGNIKQKVVELYDQFKAGNADVAWQVMELLQTWIVSHIADIDKRYAPFFISKGLA